MPCPLVRPSCCPLLRPLPSHSVVYDVCVQAGGEAPAEAQARRMAALPPRVITRQYTDWHVRPNYKMLDIVGHGSYGEVRRLPPPRPPLPTLVCVALLYVASVTWPACLRVCPCLPAGDGCHRHHVTTQGVWPSGCVMPCACGRAAECVFKCLCRPALSSPPCVAASVSLRLFVCECMRCECGVAA